MEKGENNCFMNDREGNKRQYGMHGDRMRKNQWLVMTRERGRQQAHDGSTSGHNRKSQASNTNSDACTHRARTACLVSTQA
uniref:Uncharacterized protein n=1 Tax=Ascaris lumbricoides TaxID=6252 RepID=A0A0M3IK05_ASCLU